MAIKIISAAALVAVVLASTVLQSTYAASFTVGDNTGWTVPPGGGNNEFYDNWAENKTFVVGDILDFNFATGAHNVAEVSEADYDTCNGTNPIATHGTGPASVTLNRTGEYHFICTVPGHCIGGQKLSVEVRNGPRTGTPGSGPNGSSSASSLVAAVSLSIMSVALVLFC